MFKCRSDKKKSQNSKSSGAPQYVSLQSKKQKFLVNFAADKASLSNITVVFSSKYCLIFYLYLIFVFKYFYFFSALKYGTSLATFGNGQGGVSLGGIRYRSASYNFPETSSANKCTAHYPRFITTSEDVKVR